MQWKPFALSLVLSTFLAATGCGDDQAAGPNDPDDAQQLIGRWQFASTDLFDHILAQLTLFLQGLGASEADIATAQQELLGEDNQGTGLFSDGYLIHLAGDRTWTDSDGDTGTWSTRDDQLTLVTDGSSEPPITFRYALSGDRLTLAISSRQIQELMRATEEPDEEEIAFFALFFPPEEAFSILLTRVE